jgi:hypothetical protein
VLDIGNPDQKLELDAKCCLEGGVTWAAAALGFPVRDRSRERRLCERGGGEGASEAVWGRGKRIPERCRAFPPRHSPQKNLPFGPEPWYRARMSSSNCLTRQTLEFGCPECPIPQLKANIQTEHWWNHGATIPLPSPSSSHQQSICHKAKSSST